jgi:predicted dehydrogenase
MYKAVVLGTENSHALQFARLINGGHPSRGGRGYADFRVTGAYGYDGEANRKIQTEGGVEYIAEHYGDFAGKADAVIITARHGDNHFKYAEPYLKSGVPIFVDKPITIDPGEAVKLAEAAKSSGTPLCGGSCCGWVTAVQELRLIVQNPGFIGRIMGGSVGAPVSMKNDYGDFYFYAQHLVQIMLEIFGYDMLSVSAFSREDSVTAVCGYKDYDVTGHFGPEEFSAVVYGEKKSLYRNIDISTDGYARQTEIFADMVRTREMPRSYGDFIKPVFVLNALAESMQTGREVSVKNPEV